MSDHTTFNNTNANLRPIIVHAPKSYALSGKIMLSAIVILFVVVALMICLHMYARWYLLRVRRRYLHRRRSRRQRASNIVFYVDQHSVPVHTANRGLEVSVLNSLPLFVYSELTHKELDCAVCLSEFEEGETGRVLPKCHHSFHIECIDMWFHSHSTCPICRARVEPVDPTRTRDVLISVDKPVQSVEPSGSGSRETSLAERRKGLDLGGVKIEVPRRTESVDELRPSSPASYGFMSPGNRLQSLRRILSMGKKPALVSPSSEIGTSWMGSTESDIELGIIEDVHEQTRTPMRK
ncbi:RING-H2 finger protein ATL2 [Heracleum sosnowskyi]|uniref:RING-type E3 ubiquitin transferase n=1 Tax=Heracleum sosnowskyi TaxID=360622 RepID=A0AAD8IL75_9APIA|nr:RING-H2 finger protein ATL2 [Heracleum sosnowskyi]